MITTIHQYNYIFENVNLPYILYNVERENISDFVSSILLKNINKFSLNKKQFFDINPFINSILFLNTNIEEYFELITTNNMKIKVKPVYNRNYFDIKTTENMTLYTIITIINTNDITHRFFFDETQNIAIFFGYYDKLYTEKNNNKKTKITLNYIPTDCYLNVDINSISYYEKLLNRHNIYYRLFFENEHIKIFFNDPDDFIYYKLLND